MSGLPTDRQKQAADLRASGMSKRRSAEVMGISATSVSGLLAKFDRVEQRGEAGTAARYLQGPWFDLLPRAPRMFVSTFHPELGADPHAVAAMGARKMSAIRGLGPKSIKQIQDVLRSLGYEVKP